MTEENKPPEEVKPPQPVSRKNVALEELKHSISLHTILYNGPSQQLAAFLIKLVDFVEDEDKDRRNKEMLDLAFHITESLGIFTQQSIDERAKKAAAEERTFPPRAMQAANDLLITIGKARSHPNKVEAKNAILRSIAHALRELSQFTKAKYPKITDSQRQEL